MGTHKWKFSSSDYKHSEHWYQCESCGLIDHVSDLNAPVPSWWNSPCPPASTPTEPPSTPTTKPTNPKDAIGELKVPVSTVPGRVTFEVGLALLEGAVKYQRHNYRRAGVRASVYYNAAMRHLTAWWEGQDLDPDSGLSHIVKAIAGLYVLRDSMLQGNWVDDRPPAVDPKWVDELNAQVKALLAKYPEPKGPCCENLDVEAALGQRNR